VSTLSLHDALPIFAVMDDPLSRDAGVENTKDRRRQAARGRTLRQAQGGPSRQASPGPQDEGRSGRGAPHGEPVEPRGAAPTPHDGGGKPLFRKPGLDEMGTAGAHAVPAGRSLFRKNSLDEMTVARTEKPLGKTPRARPHGEAVEPHGEHGEPVEPRRYKPGAGSYEDPADERRRTRRPKKTGRPGR